MNETHEATPSDAGDATPAIENDNLEYTLTLKQVPEIFAQHHRQVPSERSLQRYCSSDAPPFKSKKIKTTYGQEWLVSESSLLAYIKTLPIEPDATEIVSTVTPVIGDASVAMRAEKIEDRRDDSPDSVANGERRTLAQVLIENARLVSAVEGRDQLIAAMLDDKTFLREELREHRKNRDDIKTLANKMLETLEAMALGGRLLRQGNDGAATPAEVIHVDVNGDRGANSRQAASTN